MPGRKRILYVAMHHSIHTARWIEFVADADFDLHMYPLDPAPAHSALRNITLHVPTEKQTDVSADAAIDGSMSVSQSIGGERRGETMSLAERAAAFARFAIRDPAQASRRLTSRARQVVEGRRSATASVVPGPVQPPVPAVRTNLVRFRPAAGMSADPHVPVVLGRAGESDACTIALHGPQMLALVIQEVKPDLIHSMEFQHAAYLVLAARDLLLHDDPIFRFPRWLATNWGSDIYNFGRLPEHARQIWRVCEAIDLYSCECHRDLELGRQFGYRGPTLPVLPNSGGVDVAEAEALRDRRPPSKRKTIMIKGYDHFAGRAMTSLAILERFAERLKGYEIVMFSVGARPRSRALELKAAGALDIKVIDWAPHSEILACFGRSRLYMGISTSDGISTSVLELMLMGAFPIQTNTSCCDEWFVPGETGFAVPPDDIEEIAARFEQALTDDALVDAASPRNLDIITARLDRRVIGPKVLDFYAQALTPSLGAAAGALRS